MRRHKGAWMFWVVAMFAWFAPGTVKATPEPGLNVTVYNNFGYNASPPLPNVTNRPVQCTTTYPNINQTFNTVCNLYDDFIVKYEGFITSPTDATIIFHPTADDGTKLYIDGTLIDNNWYDKGGGGNYSTAVEFTSGVPKPITFWYYENGGGAWVNLAWNIDGDYVTVPAEAFTKTSESAYTTTTTSTTTTTVAPYFNEVQNLTAVANSDGSVFLDWDAPVSSNTAPYMYNISFYDLVDGQETSGWGVWTYAANTSYSLGPWMWPGTTGYGPVRFKIQAGTAPCVGEGNGSCLYGPQVSVDATVVEPTPTTTTVSSTTTSTTTTEPSTTTTSSTTLPATTTTTTTEPVQTTTTTSTTTTTTTTTTTVPTTTTTTSTTVPPTTTTTEAPYTPPQTTTTSPTIETLPVTTTTEPETTVDEPETTEPETSTTEPEEIIVPDTTEPETLVTVPATIIVPDTTEPETSTTYPDGLPEDIVEPVETTIPETTVPVPEVEIVPDETEQPTNTTQPQEYTTETTLLEETDSSLTTLPLIIENKEVLEFIENIENATVEELLSNVDNLLEQELSNEELEAVFDAVFNDNLSDEETIELAQEVLKGELDAEEFSTVIDAIFDEVVTDEVLIETFTAVLETELDEEKFEAVVDVLESDVISKEQVAEVVTLIIQQEGGVNAEQATELATSSKVLESIDGEQATEVFDAVVASEVSPEDGAAIVEAVQNAPEEVKEAFEEEINVFEGVFDEYVPTGSSISVAERRAVIAATAVLFVAPLPIPTTSSSQTASSRNKG